MGPTVSTIALYGKGQEPYRLLLFGRHFLEVPSSIQAVFKAKAQIRHVLVPQSALSPHAIRIRPNMHALLPDHLSLAHHTLQQSRCCQAH